MKTGKKTIAIFTEKFPYEGSEPFLENEIKIASRDHDIIVFPRISKINTTIQRDLPSNVKVVHLVDSEFDLGGRRVFLKNLFFNIKLLAIEVFKTGRFLPFFYRGRELFAFINKSQSLSEKIIQYFTENKLEHVIYYSYWMNEWSLALCIAKVREKKISFVIRLHGYDIFDNRHPNNYLPFRYTNYKYAVRVFVASEHAIKYLKGLNMFPEKITYSPICTFDYGIGIPGKSNNLVILSCSRVIPLKRVHLIPLILEKLNCQVKWIHIGNGPEIKKVMSFALNCSKRIDFEILPFFNNADDYMGFVKSQSINLFLHVSETEGFGVVLIEALSLGIPIFSTNVGVASELVKSELSEKGLLIDVDFDVSEVAHQLDLFFTTYPDSIEFRKQLRNIWVNKFNAEEVYPKFFSEMTQISNY